MRKTLQKSLQLFRSGKAIRIAYHIVCLLIACSLFLQFSFAFDFGDVSQSFSSDFNRRDAIEMKGWLVSAISDLSGMKSGNDVKIVFKSRGDVKQESFIMDMKLQGMTNESCFSAYEYLLKQFHLIQADANLREIFLDSMYDQVYGFYDPDTKNLVIMERTSGQIAAMILLHELMHAAQDSAVDLRRYQEKNCNTIDSCLASACLLEGQASAIDLLIKIEQNLEDKTSKDVLRTVYERMQSTGDKAAAKEPIDILSKVRLFPYVEGLKFVIGRYLDDQSFTSMFEQVPVSTAQILHPEKFNAKQKPVLTELSGKKASLGKVPGVKLILDTTLGEYYIQAILCQNLGIDVEKIRDAAAGWAGDSIHVFQNGRGRFLIWDTLWETPKDADEFYHCYLDFFKMRYNTVEFPQDTRSDVLLLNDSGTLYMAKHDKRVLIVEGELTAVQLEPIRRILGL